MSQAPAQVVVVGSGFAGFFAARKLARVLPRELAEVTMVSATDHMGYSPQRPRGAAGCSPDGRSRDVLIRSASRSPCTARWAGPASCRAASRTSTSRAGECGWRGARS